MAAERFLQLCFFNVDSEEKNPRHALHPHSQTRRCCVTSCRRRSCLREKRIAQPMVHWKNFCDFGSCALTCFASVYFLMKRRAHPGSGQRRLEREPRDPAAGDAEKDDSDDAQNVVAGV
ncbi:hypothetical protein DFH09DRAFT_1320300 [Mycena vulgaris]|nr:hypothetical protein DFH09DRAFT_1320300 [Mycena vulgaris]